MNKQLFIEVLYKIRIYKLNNYHCILDTFDDSNFRISYDDTPPFREVVRSGDRKGV